MTDLIARPPRDNLVRALRPGPELRSVEGGPPVMQGHFAVFNEWSEIDSMWEGHFMERIAPGAFTKTITENRDRVKVTFNHGHDPDLGDKVLGPIDSLSEDATGAAYEVPLFPSVPPLIVDGLRAGQYGSSFRFQVMKEEFDQEPKVSDHNPAALPERTITEVRLFEFGPVTYPAYAGATAGVRSLTDEFFMDQFMRGEGLKKLAEYVKDAPAPKPASTTSEPERETPEPAPSPVQKQEGAEVAVDIDKFTSKGDLVNRKQEIEDRQTAMNAEYATRAFDAAAQTEWDELKEEQNSITARLAHLAEREAVITSNGTSPGHTEPERVYTPPNVITESNPFDMAAVRRDSRSPEEEERKLKENARRIVDRAVFPHEKAKQDDVREHVNHLLATIDRPVYLARRIAATGSEVYARALGKALAFAPMTEAERNALAVPMEIERALSLTGSAGGFAVPFVLDPTIIPTSNGAVNPFRQISRVENITVDEWRGVSSAGITAAYAAEATETTDNAPTLAQPTVSTEKAQAFVPFSIEVGQDWDGLQSQMAVLLQDAKDELEAAKFVSGTGTNEPFGVITGATTTVNATTGQTFTIANLYALEEALPPRFRPRASIVANRAIFNRVRQFDTAGGAGLWVDNLGSGLGTTGMTDGRLRQGLLSYPTYESSAMASSPATGNLFMIMGDFRYYLIADRIGLNVETIQHLVGTNHRPTGQRGLYAYWRNGAKVLNAAAFRVMIGIA